MKICGCKKGRCMIHRESKTTFYRKWWHIRARCTFKWDKDYSNYGGRGIKFEWNTYLEFKNDMQKSYLSHVKKYGEKNTTIDRIDVNKNYNKENCKWATTTEQSNNKRNSRKITMNGKTKTISEWAKGVGMSHEALSYRLKNGLDLKTALTMKIDKKNRYANI